MTEIIIIRHGETEWNKTGRFQGQSDVPLSAEGRAQAEVLGRNLHFGKWEGRFFSEINEETPDMMTMFYRNPEEVAIPESEPFAVFQKRVSGRVRTIAAAHRDERVVLVSHGAAIRILFADILSMPVRAIWHVSQLNTAVNRIRFEDDGFAILTLMNDISHLRAEAQQ